MFLFVSKDVKALVAGLKAISYHDRTDAAVELKLLSADPQRKRELARYATDALIASLTDGGHWQIRSVAATALGNIGEQKAIAPLMYALLDAESIVADDAAQSLYILRKTHPEALQRESIRFLQVIDAKNNESLSAYIRWMFGDASAIPLLIRDMASDNSGLRGRAIQALGHTSARAAIDQLSSIISDKENGWRAIEGLGRIGQPDTIPILMEYLDRGGNYMHAVPAIQRIGGPGAVDALIVILATRSKSMVAAFTESIINSLVEFGDARARKTIAELLDKPDIHDPTGSVQKAIKNALRVLPT